MRCPPCQLDNREGARFCAACGNILAVMCAAWGNQTPPKAAFCDHRGIPPVGQMPASPSRLLPRRPQTPVNYTPRYLAEKILTSRFALEGEPKRATILFADLKGSMELLADRDPEDARRLLDTVLTLMMDAVHRYEGTGNQVLGDGIMAPFGSPIAYEDHAVRGCYEASRMQELVKQYAVEVQRTIGLPLHIRFGLNSGEVVVRAISSDLHTHCSVF
jgi:class 3 adenylate cyclase